MSVLGQQKIVRLEMPAEEGEAPDFVALNVNLKAGLLLDASKADDTREITVNVLAQSIIDWSYTTEDGQKALITADNIRQLPYSAFSKLDNYMMSRLKSSKEVMSEAEKKA